MPTHYEPPQPQHQPPIIYQPPDRNVAVGPAAKQPWVQDPQRYAINTLTIEHNEALWTFGEYTMFVLLWNALDFESDLVQRCPTCYTTYGKIADTYGQGGKEKCPDCFGTSFQGGYRAKVIRPALFAPEDVDNLYRQRGVVQEATTQVEATNDFTLHHGDYIFRGDGTRWTFQRPDSEVALTGFQTNSLGPFPGWNVGTVMREDEGSVAYIIPPGADELVTLLNRSYIRRPLDYVALDEVRGPL